MTLNCDIKRVSDVVIRCKSCGTLNETEHSYNFGVSGGMENWVKGKVVRQWVDQRFVSGKRCLVFVLQAEDSVFAGHV